MALKIIRRPNSPNWFLRGTVRGRTVFESTGTEKKQVAEEIRIKREEELLRESVHGLKATCTFEDAVLDYLESGGDGRFIGEWNAKTGTGTWLFKHFAGRRINDITQSDLDRAARDLLPNGNWQTRNRQVYTPFIAIHGLAVRNNVADPHRWRRPQRPKGVGHDNRPTRRGATTVEYQKAAEFIRWMSPAAGIMALTLMYTGCRPGELIPLEADDLKPDDAWLVIRSSKSGLGRGVPLHPVLIPMLRALKERGGIVFRNHKGEPYPIRRTSGGQLRSAFRGARERSGIDDMSPNTFRHMVQTQLVMNGFQEATIQRIVGHAARTVAQRHYIELPKPHLIEAIETLPVPEVLHDIPWLVDPMPYLDRLVDTHRSKRLGHPVYMRAKR